MNLRFYKQRIHKLQLERDALKAEVETLNGVIAKHKKPALKKAAPKKAPKKTEE